MNPATLLHDLLTKYRTPEGDVRLEDRWHISDDPVTHVISDDDRSALLEAAQWLTRIDQILNDIDEADGTSTIFRKYYPLWVNAIFSIGSDWTVNVNPTRICEESAVDMLASLAVLFDKTNDQISADVHAVLIGLVDEIRAVLAEDTTLDPQLRSHIRRVVDHLDECLADLDRFDAHDVTVAVDDVVTSVKAAAGESTEHASRWASIRDKIILPTVSGLVANAPSIALQITTGH